MYACSAKRPPHEVLFAATRSNLGILRKPPGEDGRNLFCSAGILPACRSRLRALPSLAKKLSSPHRLNSQTPFIRIEWHPFSISSSLFSARRASILKCCHPEFARTPVPSSSALRARPRCQSEEAVAPRQRGNDCGLLLPCAAPGIAPIARCCHYEVAAAAEGSAFSANSSNLFRISTCKKSRRNPRAINTSETKYVNSTEMSTCNKCGEGRAPRHKWVGPRFARFKDRATPKSLSSRGRRCAGVPNVPWFCAGWGGGDRGICF